MTTTAPAFTTIRDPHGTEIGAIRVAADGTHHAARTTTDGHGYIPVGEYTTYADAENALTGHAIAKRLPRHLLDHLLDNTTGDHPGQLITTTFDEDHSLTARGLAYTDDAGDTWMSRAGWEAARHHAAHGTRARALPHIIDEPLAAALPTCLA